ncbi:ABC transporter ATP-binding protein, partial [Streptomyces durbertensis]
PYTRGLLDSLPRLDDHDDTPLRAIAGSPPSLLRPLPGCAFAPRCPHAADDCHSRRPDTVRDGERLVACHLPLTTGAAR